MSNRRYPEEFKIEAVKQVAERGLRAADVAERQVFLRTAWPCHAVCPKPSARTMARSSVVGPC